MSSTRLFLAALLVAGLAFTSSAAAKPAPPAGVPVVGEGQLPHICGEGDASESGTYYDTNAKQWLSAPNCYARWGNLEMSPPRLAMFGDKVTVAALPNGGSNSATYAPQTKSITWDVGGAKVKSGCGPADLTCTVLPTSQVSLQWQWVQIHVSMPRTFFVDSPGDLCAGQHLCGGVTTNAWTWIGIPPAICKVRHSARAGVVAPVATIAQNRSAISRATLDCLSGYLAFSATVNGGAGWLLEQAAPLFLEVGPEGPPAAKLGGRVLQGLGAVNGLIAGGLYTLSKDPPDSHFKKLAKAKAPKVEKLTASGPLTKQIAPSMNKLQTLIAQTGALALAMEQSRDRAGGAHRAHSHAWERRQMRATGSFAKRLATSLTRLRTACRRAAAAYRAAGLDKFDVTAEQVAAYKSALKKGLPAAQKAELRAAGATSSVIGKISKGVRSADAGALRLGIEDGLADPRMLADYARDAAFLRGYAKRVARRPSTATN